MITSKGEYEFVTFKDDIIINGEIMPLREEERKNDLRGEDPAFLLEAQGERHEAMWGWAKKKEEMTKEIQGERLKGIVKRLLEDANLGSTYWAACFIKEQLPERDIYDLATEDVAKELGLLFNTWDFQSKVWNFESGGTLRRSHMEALFSDADMMRIPYLTHVEATTIKLSHSVNKGQTGLSYPYEPTINDDLLYDYYAWGEELRHDGQIDISGAWHEATVNGGSLSYDLTEARSKWLKPVTRTLCICGTRVSYRKGGDSDYSQNVASNAYDVFSCPSSQTGSVVTMDASALADGAKRFLSHYHFDKKKWPFYGAQIARVFLRYIIPVCEMGDHTRW